MLFPNTVLNAPSSYVSIELGIQGVKSTRVQSFFTAKAAILFACDQLRKGKADLIQTGGVDELSEPLFRGFSDLRLLATDQGHGENRVLTTNEKRFGIGRRRLLLVIENEDMQTEGAKICGYI